MNEDIIALQNIKARIVALEAISGKEPIAPNVGLFAFQEVKDPCKLYEIAGLTTVNQDATQVSVSEVTWFHVDGDLSASASNIGSPEAPYIVADRSSDPMTITAQASIPTGADNDTKRLLATLTYTGSVITAIKLNHVGDIFPKEIAIRVRIEGYIRLTTVSHGTLELTESDGIYSLTRIMPNIYLYTKYLDPQFFASIQVTIAEPCTCYFIISTTYEGEKSIASYWSKAAPVSGEYAKDYDDGPQPPGDVQLTKVEVL